MTSSDDFGPEMEPPEGEASDNIQHQQVQMSGVTARVPPSIGHGTFSTGAIVMTGAHTFVLDFLQQVGVPANLVSRLVLPHPVLPQFIQALEKNLEIFQQRFGPITELPKRANPPKQPSVQEIYDNLKLPDEELPGHFANAVIIRHTPADFCFEFVTHFYPHAAISSRIFMSAPHVPPLLKALKANYEKFKQRRPPDPPQAE